jgi:hypothetical protein
MAVPQVERVEAVLGEEIEVLGPEGLVVEERERLRGIRVLVDAPPGQKVGLLHADARPAQDHDGRVGEVQVDGKLL